MATAPGRDARTRRAYAALVRDAATRRWYAALVRGEQRAHVVARAQSRLLDRTRAVFVSRVAPRAGLEQRARRVELSGLVARAVRPVAVHGPEERRGAVLRAARLDVGRVREQQPHGVRIAAPCGPVQGARAEQRGALEVGAGVDEHARHLARAQRRGADERRLVPRQRAVHGG